MTSFDVLQDALTRISDLGEDAGVMPDVVESLLYPDALLETRFRVQLTALSPMELERLSRDYMRSMAEFTGPDIDIPAPDVYTNAMVMGWMADEYEAIKRVEVPAAITGKPIARGGRQGVTAAQIAGLNYL